MRPGEDSFFSRGTAGLYLHLPFCSSKCHYCDFYSFVPENDDLTHRARAYHQALLTEIRTWSDWLAKHQPDISFDTIFIGGGTPNYYPLAFLKELVRELARLPGVPKFGDLREFTVEANPEHLTEEEARAWREMGISRVSMGIQTTSQNGLKTLGREAGPEEVNKAVKILAGVFPGAWSADFIYGWPGQRKSDLYRDLEVIKTSKPAHASWYGLTLEAGTRYHREVLADFARPPDEDFIADWYPQLTRELAEQSLIQYEISNFARVKGNNTQRAFSPSWHNLHYWLGHPYLGLGVSAHGFLSNWRYQNPGNLATYLKRYGGNHTKIPAPPLAGEESGSGTGGFWRETWQTADIALTLLRLALPFPDAAVRKLAGDRGDVVIRRLEDWAGRGALRKFNELAKNPSGETPPTVLAARRVFGDDPSQNWYQWDAAEGLLQLDRFMVELIQDLPAP